MFRRFRPSRDKPGRESCFRFPSLSSFESLLFFQRSPPPDFLSPLLFPLPCFFPPFSFICFSLTFHFALIFLPYSPLSSAFFSMSHSTLLSPVPYFSFISPISHLLPAISSFLFLLTLLYLPTLFHLYLPPHSTPFPSLSTFPIDSPLRFLQDQASPRFFQFLAAFREKLSFRTWSESGIPLYSFLARFPWNYFIRETCCTCSRELRPGLDPINSWSESWAKVTRAV